MEKISRRHFLSSLALLGTASLGMGLCGAAPLSSPKKFSGDDPDEAHRLLRDTTNYDHSQKAESDPHLYDVIIAGGGVAGLAAAYELRHRDLLLLERQRELGGVARSENWRGIDYCIGSAYMIRPDPGSRIARLLHDLGLDGRGRVVTDDNRVVVTRQSLLRTVMTPANSDFFKLILKNRYPTMPPTDRELLALDAVTFEGFLNDTNLQSQFFRSTVGPVSKEALESIEYYCWGALGASMKELSAYQALNFFAAEFDDVLAFPGGNACVAKRLARKIKIAKPHALRTGFYVLRIEPAENKREFQVTAYHRRRIFRFRSRTIILSSPLFLAKTILPFLPLEQQKAIESLDYRAYVVANILLRRPLATILKHPLFHDIYSLSRATGVDVAANTPEKLWEETVFSDMEVAEWATRGASKYSVLTFYCPLPYGGGKNELEHLEFGYYEKAIRDQALKVLGPHGLKATHIADIRLTRWGHAMIVAKPGQLVNNVLTQAAKPLPGLSFAHTDIFGAPAIENALNAAFLASAQVQKVLESQKELGGRS